MRQTASRHPPVALQPRRNAPCARSGAVHQRAAVTTFELKNSLTKQTVEDAVEQYKRDRDPRETLFQFGRCVVHFAVDDNEVRMCTRAQGQGLVVSALQSGWNDGAGNPPNPEASRPTISWRAILTRPG